MRNTPNDMLKLAQEALQLAYCPYSNFAVAACIRTSEGGLFTGCNVENAAYSLCCCAELNAIGNMVNAGHQHIEQILVLIKGKEPASPCGGCRQQINEFASDTTEVFLCCTQGEHQHYLANQLLPHAFNPQLLESS